jgi:hypothetical protein
MSQNSPFLEVVMPAYIKLATIVEIIMSLVQVVQGFDFSITNILATIG